MWASWILLKDWTPGQTVQLGGFFSVFDCVAGAAHGLSAANDMSTFEPGTGFIRKGSIVFDSPRRSVA